MKMFRSNSGIFFFMFLLFFPSASLADPRTSIAEIICGNSSYSDKNFFTENYIKNMEGLFQLARDHQWGTVIINSSSMPPIYGLIQCFSDLSPTECLLCYAECHMKIAGCLPSYSSRMFLDGCFLRYDNYNFFKEFVDDEVDRTTCDATVLVQEILKPEFMRNAAELMINLSSIAPKHGGFRVGMRGNGENSVYGLVQCWKNITIEGCSLCLQKGWREMKSCLPGREGKALLAGCYLRYSDYEFYNRLYRENHQGFPRIGIIMVLSTSIFTASLLCFFAIFLFTRRFKRKKREKKKLGKTILIQKKSHLNFKYEVLEKATNFFEKSKKLGQGGAGTVYKGTLPDGRTVAVKRLFYSTTQWVDEFFNEVNLVSGFQHKNLVKLLGCSIEGPESLLVYEYMPNKSLDQYFTHGEMNSLNWEQRYNIIVGVAEGLAYLHCGSEKRIIHRDIKRSNILLDENLNAKIADFGLARCFASDKSHLSTGIAGTVGYMAPEYLVRGQLSEKVDIYSFGVLVLEVVCGRTNNAHLQDSGSVLHMVWRNYKSGALEESIDNSLRTNFLEKEAIKVIQIGLLCAQASASLRPSIEEVLQMLTDRDFVIPVPMQPPFLSSSKVFSDICDISVFSTSS